MMKESFWKIVMIKFVLKLFVNTQNIYVLLLFTITTNFSCVKRTSIYLNEHVESFEKNHIELVRVQKRNAAFNSFIDSLSNDKIPQILQYQMNFFEDSGQYKHLSLRYLTSIFDMLDSSQCNKLKVIVKNHQIDFNIFYVDRSTRLKDSMKFSELLNLYDTVWNRNSEIKQRFKVQALVNRKLNFNHSYIYYQKGYGNLSHKEFPNQILKFNEDGTVFSFYPSYNENSQVFIDRSKSSEMYFCWNKTMDTLLIESNFISLGQKEILTINQKEWFVLQNKSLIQVKYQQNNKILITTKRSYRISEVRFILKEAYMRNYFETNF